MAKASLAVWPLLEAYDWTNSCLVAPIVFSCNIQKTLPEILGPAFVGSSLIWDQMKAKTSYLSYL